jgi:hypothetical protein
MRSCLSNPGAFGREQLQVFLTVRDCERLEVSLENKVISASEAKEKVGKSVLLNVNF